MYRSLICLRLWTRDNFLCIKHIMYNDLKKKRFWINMVGHIYFSTLFSFEACEDFRHLLRCSWHTRGPSSFIPLLLQGEFPPPSFRTHPGADTKHWDPPTNSGMCTPHGEMPIHRCTGNYTSIARNFLQFGMVHYNATVW